MSTRAPDDPALDRTTGPAYHRDRLTWTMFSGLFGFGVLNAILGPALPYLRAEEHISYLAGALHQLAFAIGGGLALVGPLYARNANVQLASGAAAVIVFVGAWLLALAVV